MKIVLVTRLDLGECIARKKPNVNARHLLSHQEAQAASGNEYIIEFFPYEKKCKKENSSGETELLDTIFE